MKNFLFFILTFSLYANVYTQSPDLTSIEMWTNSKVENIEIINTSEEEFSPYIWNNYLLYIAVQEKTRWSKKGPIYFDIKASMLIDSSIIKYFMFNEELNSQYHEGPLSWSQATDKLFFTRGNSKDKQPVVDAQGRQLLYIYEADYAQGKWLNIEKLSFCTEEENYCHPASFNNGGSLIFASTIPGGSGKMDLYKTDRISEFTWSTPVNLGKQINNPDNDWFPFVIDDILYYATDLKDGKGLDIYASKIDVNGQAGPIVRLPSPINSEYDDFGLVISSDKKEAYFTSNRPGGKGKDDVYKVTFDQARLASSSNPVSNEQPSATILQTSQQKAPEARISETSKREIKIVVTDQLSKSGIAEANITIYVLPTSIADNFVQQLESNSDIVLLETMANNIASSINYTSNTNGSLDLSLQENQHLFILVKKQGYKSEYNYVNTKNNLTELAFELRR